MVDRQLPFQERACFWWADEEVIAPAFAAQTHVYGTISIFENGRTEIEIDGVMPTDQHPFVENLSNSEPRGDISGLTIRSNEYFRMISPTVMSRNASSKGFSYQKWSALLCLLRIGSVIKNADLKYNTLQMSLGGYEEWLGTRGAMPKFKRGRRVLLDQIGQEKTFYKTDDGSVTIDFDLTVTFRNPSGSEIMLKQDPSLTYRFRKQKEIDSIFHVHRGLNDIFLLVTDRERTLAWPSVKRHRAKVWTDIYFEIPDRSQQAVTRTDCWTYFPHIKEDFGRILNTWQSRFFGSKPAFYLYGGTRRQERIYTEHKFINLVWGLEALSNPAYDITRNLPLIEKVDRIREEIKKSKLKSSDRSMAIRSVEHALKPTLADRLVDIIESLDIGISPDKTKKFSEQCAESRNSLSHEGGARRNVLYQDFIKNTFRLSVGLDVIYHLKLLQELGLESSHIRAIINTIFLSNQIRARLRFADLEPEPLADPLR